MDMVMGTVGILPVLIPLTPWLSPAWSSTIRQ